MKKDHPWNKAIKADTVGRRPRANGATKLGGAEKRLKAAIAGKVKKKYKVKYMTEVDGDWQD